MKLDLLIFKSLKFHKKGYYYFIVPTTVRRSGMQKVSIKKYEQLKAKFSKES